MTRLGTLEARLRTAALRVRAQRALDGVVLGAAWALGLVALAVAGSHVLHTTLSRGVFGLAMLPLATGAIAALRSVAQLPIALSLDRSHGLPDLLSSAWSFAQLEAPRRSPFMEVTLARAERAAGAIEVARSYPLRWPARLGWLALAAAGTLGAWQLGRLQPSAAAPMTPMALATAPERLLSEAELAAFRRRLADQNPVAQPTPRTTALRGELERALDELAHGPADRLAMLRRLRALEARAHVLGARPGPELAAAEKAAADWKDAPGTTAPVHGPLAEPPPVPEAPPAAKTPPPEPKPRSLEREQRDEDETPELPPTGAAPSPSPGEARGNPNAPARGGPPPQPIAAAPSSGANDAPRGPELERSEAEERERGRSLANSIAELRDLIQRDETLPADPNDPTQGTPRSPRDPKQNPPDRDDSRADRTGSPNAAYASAGPPPQNQGDGEAPPSDVSPLPAAASRVTGQTADGPVRSQVIYGAAERGFAGRDYERVHGEYERHAERELERDAVPPGYRSYVRRYFQSIAPRPNP